MPSLKLKQTSQNEAPPLVNVLTGMLLLLVFACNPDEKDSVCAKASDATNTAKRTENHSLFFIILVSESLPDRHAGYLHVRPFGQRHHLDGLPGGWRILEIFTVNGID